MNSTMKTLAIAFVIAITGFIGSAMVWAGLQYGDTRWVTVASTERALLRQYKLDALDLEYLEKKGQITEREQLQLDQIRIDIEELEQELN